MSSPINPISRSKEKRIESILKRVQNLKKSPLYAYRVSNRYLPVIGEGNPDATIVFIGEAPGKKEAETGHPFCGSSGKVLDNLLSTIGLDRKKIYITNIVNDRPPGNRDPTFEEIALYSPFLLELLSVIRPKVIATLGRFSMQFILQQLNHPHKSYTITNLHGKKLQGKLSYGDVMVIPLYHPAAALYKGSLLESLKKDFQKLKIYR